MNYFQFSIESAEIQSKFKIEIPKLIAIYEREIEYYHRYCVGKIADDAPRHIEFKAISKLKTQLEQSVIHKTDIIFTSNDYVEVFATRLVIKKEFESAHCFRCEDEYKPHEVLIENWTEGEYLHAEGGSKMFCKNRHLLLKMTSWNS
jgi:hypothetical protein